MNNEQDSAPKTRGRLDVKALAEYLRTEEKSVRSVFGLISPDRKLILEAKSFEELGKLGNSIRFTDRNDAEFFKNRRLEFVEELLRRNTDGIAQVYDSLSTLKRHCDVFGSTDEVMPHAHEIFRGIVAEITNDPKRRPQNYDEAFSALRIVEKVIGNGNAVQNLLDDFILKEIKENGDGQSLEGLLILYKNTGGLELKAIIVREASRRILNLQSALDAFRFVNVLSSRNVFQTDLETHLDQALLDANDSESMIKVLEIPNLQFSLDDEFLKFAKKVFLRLLDEGDLVKAEEWKERAFKNCCVRPPSWFQSKKKDWEYLYNEAFDHKHLEGITDNIPLEALCKIKVPYGSMSYSRTEHLISKKLSEKIASAKDLETLLEIACNHNLSSEHRSQIREKRAPFLELGFANAKSKEEYGVFWQRLQGEEERSAWREKIVKALAKFFLLPEQQDDVVEIQA